MSELDINIDLTLKVIPIFLSLLIIEWAIGAYKGKKLYDIKDTLANLGISLLFAIPGAISKALFYLLYTIIHKYAIFNIDYSWWAFILCFLGSDLTFYIFHRLGHVTQFFWAGHVTHHSSKEYNLSISYRISMQMIYRFMFWIPLVIIGFEPIMIVLTITAINLYMFFLHTKFIKNLGFLEWFLNTPSHHRVHHATNPQYLDMNYGGVLIIWDKFLRTFEPEREEPVYGITEEIKTNNPINLIFDEYAYTFKNLRTKSISDGVKFLFGKPQAHEESINVKTSHDCTSCKLICPFKSPMEHFLGHRINKVRGVEIQMT